MFHCGVVIVVVVVVCFSPIICFYLEVNLRLLVCFHTLVYFRIPVHFHLLDCFRWQACSLCCFPSLVCFHVLVGFCSLAWSVLLVFHLLVCICLLEFEKECKSYARICLWFLMLVSLYFYGKLSGQLIVCLAYLLTIAKCSFFYMTTGHND